MLAEHILERLVVRWDRTLHLRLRAFDEGGTHLDLRGSPEWLRNRIQKVLETGLAPASDFTSIPSDFWRMLVEPGASQDDIHHGFHQYQKLVGFFMRTSHLQLQRGISIIKPSMPQRLSLNGLNSEIPGLPLTGQVEPG